MMLVTLALTLLVTTGVVAQSTYNINFFNNPSCQNSLQTILSRGKLNCGTYADNNLFGVIDGATRKGFDADLCKAVSVALFNSTQVQFFNVTNADRWDVVKMGTVDMVAFSSTQTAQRMAQYNVHFSPVMLYDGAGMAVKRNAPQNMTMDVKNMMVCAPSATSTIEAVQKFGNMYGLNISVNSSLTEEQMYAAFMRNECMVVASDKSALAARINSTTDRILLGADLSKEPLAPYVSADNTKLAMVLDLVMNGLQLAEEKMITKANAASAAAIYPSEVGASLGLHPNFMNNVVKEVGNYGELYNMYINSSIPRHSSLNNLYNASMPSNHSALFYPHN